MDRVGVDRSDGVMGLKDRNDRMWVDSCVGVMELCGQER